MSSEPEFQELKLEPLDDVARFNAQQDFTRPGFVMGADGVVRPYMPPPVDMSQFTLGPRYSSEDMYRDWPLFRPGDLASFEKDGVVYTDYVDAVQPTPVERTQAMLADVLKTTERLAFTRRQRIWRRIRKIVQR